MTFAAGDSECLPSLWSRVSDLVVSLHLSRSWSRSSLGLCLFSLHSGSFCSRFPLLFRAKGHFLARVFPRILGLFRSSFWRTFIFCAAPGFSRPNGCFWDFFDFLPTHRILCGLHVGSIRGRFSGGFGTFSVRFPWFLRGFRADFWL